MSFHSLSEGATAVSDKQLRSILLISDEVVMKNEAKLQQVFPYYSADVAIGISQAGL